MTWKSREDCDPYFYDPLSEIEARNKRMQSHEYYDEIDPGARIAEYWETVAKEREERLNAAAERDKNKS